MDKSDIGFPSTPAEQEYANAAQNLKHDLRTLFGDNKYQPGISSDILSAMSSLMGKRKRESIEAFDKLITEVLDEIDDSELIQQEKLLEGKGGGTG